MFIDARKYLVSILLNDKIKNRKNDRRVLKRYIQPNKNIKQTRRKQKELRME